MNRHFSFTGILFFFLFANTSIVAQESMDMKETTKQEKVRKNTIRFNLTNPMIFGDRSLVLGYERTLGEHQSFSINMGQASLPKFGLFDFGSDSSVVATKSSKDKGFNVTGDYRFYLASENKHRAPRGLYIGPYASHVFMGRENTWNLNTETFQGQVNSEFKFNMTAVGAQLGYQFVFWNRLALDFVLLGPGIAWYSLEAKLDTTLDPDDESALYEKLNEILEEKFPGYTFALDDVEFKKTGTSNTTSIGYRYTVHLGFRF
ncbi:MAG TPA: hypothetical protein VGK46_04145 [Saprospiraceae bacterium]